MINRHNFRQHIMRAALTLVGAATLGLTAVGGLYLQMIQVPSNPAFHFQQ